LEEKAASAEEGASLRHTCTPSWLPDLSLTLVIPARIGAPPPHCRRYLEKTRREMRERERVSRREKWEREGERGLPARQQDCHRHRLQATTSTTGSPGTTTLARSAARAAEEAAGWRRRRGEAVVLDLEEEAPAAGSERGRRLCLTAGDEEGLEAAASVGTEIARRP
jgi:hypothetical protein